MTTMNMDTDIDEEFRHIRLDDGPRLRPLGLDKMFTRVEKWGLAHPSPSTSQPIRPASPPRRRGIYPVPRPQDGISPLGGLFDYPELLPLVLGHFDHPRDLAVLARVCSSWCKIARKRLYESIWVRPWEDGCHSKLVLLFDTLHRNPELCRLVRKLDVRFFPLSAQGNQRTDLDDQVREAIEQMDNLESLVWTRDKSLTPELVEVISTHPRLRSLEISGHSNRYYDPKLIGRSPNLEELRVMMPDPNLKDSLLGVLKDLSMRDQGGLKSLGLICRSSPLIDDELLKAAAPFLGHLRRLTMWGCTKITKSSVYRILEEATGMRELSLDILPHSEMMDLSRAPDLAQLHTLSLSFYSPPCATFALDTIVTLPHLPNLTSLHLTLSSDKRPLATSSFTKLLSEINSSKLPLDTSSFTKLLSEINSSKLKRLSLLNLIISPAQLSVVLETHPDLEELYITVSSRDTLLQCDELKGSRLRVFHANAPPELGPTADDLLELARGMMGLDQIGSQNRVYEIWRSLGERGEKEVELSRWGRITTPAYFQNLR